MTPPLPDGVLLYIRQKDEGTIYIGVTRDGLSMAPSNWGSLLADVMLHIMNGYVEVNGADQEVVIREMSEKFMARMRGEYPVDSKTLLPATQGEH